MRIFDIFIGLRLNSISNSNAGRLYGKNKFAFGGAGGIEPGSKSTLAAANCLVALASCDVAKIDSEGTL